MFDPGRPMVEVLPDPKFLRPTVFSRNCIGPAGVIHIRHVQRVTPATVLERQDLRTSIEPGPYGRPLSPLS